MFKHYKRILKGEPKHRQESPSHPIEPISSRQTTFEPSSAFVPPTEAAIAAANANRGYSGTVLADKTREQTHFSPRIAAGPVLELQDAPPQAEPSVVIPSPPPVSAALPLPFKAPAPPSAPSASSTAPSDSPQRQSHAHHTQPTPHMSTQPQQISPLHVEDSGASYTSSTGSVSRAKDHKAALHSANERLQKALQNAAKPAAKAAMASPAQPPISTGSSPTPTISPPVQTTLQNAVLESPAAAGSLQKQQHHADSKVMPASQSNSQLRSEASVMSVESDDDVNDLTGKPPHICQVHDCNFDTRMPATHECVMHAVHVNEYMRQLAGGRSPSTQLITISSCCNISLDLQDLTRHNCAYQILFPCPCNIAASL